MSILAIRLSNNNTEMSFKNGELFTIKQDNKQNHSEEIINNIKECLKKGSGEISNLEYILVDVGPGGFTPIRTAICISLGLSALNKSVLIGIDTFNGIFYSNKLNKKEENIVIINISNENFVYQCRDRLGNIVYTKSNKKDEIFLKKDENCDICICNDIFESDYDKIEYNSESMIKYFCDNKNQILEYYKNKEKIIPYYSPSFIS